ncbi:TPA: hypothetical protein PXO57_000808 [Yersinia enterocolitica]|uniref:Uncharacterized protein n=1 Tax=Yersinia enterocolitica TaxID=630 RepID=A0A9P1PTZ6_YEREN|nr:hypothetical protein [Yersinia enterocolitica]EKN3513908.1 hypothetical protein [Yersinia enterocolitica]EKN4935783.1 hypothetical protein [Yersinia enterocolitica]EKN5051836.1 hypothetical protein [Yersinia enterocolitica]EKN5128393.1 hypothetical protein [Yersinia enterocolitica]EKN6117905.1 hypothetical protein [Yersinia enterocolitica]
MGSIKPKRGRPAIQYDNSTVRKWLFEHGVLTCADISLWLEDIFVGAGRLCESEAQNTNPISNSVLLSLLISHDVLSTKTVQVSLSRRKLAIDGKMITPRYARYVLACVVSLSKSIVYFVNCKAEYPKENDFHWSNEVRVNG